MKSPAPPPGPAEAVAIHCDACGGELSRGDHRRCRARRASTDPPRYCGACGRKLVVQVLPLGYTARCVKCGLLDRLPGA